MTKAVGLIETDIACIVHAEDAIQELHALLLRMCYRRPTDADIVRGRENLQDIARALATAKLWVNANRRD